MSNHKLALAVLVGGAAVAALLAATVRPAPAAECTPLPEIAVYAAEHDLTVDTILESAKPGVTAAFSEAIGYPPDDAVPTGVVLLDNGRLTVVGLIEVREGVQCVRYSLVTASSLVAIAKGRIGAGT